MSRETEKPGKLMLAVDELTDPEAVLGFGCYVFFVGLLLSWVAVVIKIVRWAFA